MDAFRAAGGLGMNVTAPFKLDAFAYATERSEAAQLAGAANAMKFEGERVLVQNYDGVGLVRDVAHNLETPLKGKRVLMLGAGGAARWRIAAFSGGRSGRVCHCQPPPGQGACAGGHRCQQGNGAWLHLC